MLNDPTPVAFAQFRESIDELGVFLYSQKLASSKTRFLLGFSVSGILRARAMAPSALVDACDGPFSRERLTDMEKVLLRPLAEARLDERRGGGRGGQNSGGGSRAIVQEQTSQGPKLLEIRQMTRRV